MFSSKSRLLFNLFIHFISHGTFFSLLFGIVFDYLSPLVIRLHLFLLMASILILLVRIYSFRDFIKTVPGPYLGWKSLFFGHFYDLLSAPLIPGTKEPNFMWRFHQWMLQHLSHGVYRVWFFNPFCTHFGQAGIIVFDIELVKEILSYKKVDHFEKGLAYLTSKPLIGEGLLSSEGEKWHHQRKVTEVAFRLGMLHKAVLVSMETCSKLCSKWERKREEHEPLDIYQDMLMLTMDVLGKVAFDYDFKSVSVDTPEEAPLFWAFDTILRGLANRTRQVPGKHLLPTLENRMFHKAMLHLDEWVEKLITTRLLNQMHKQPNQSPIDLLDALLNDNGTQKITHTQIVHNIKTFLFAGHDTTASALTWALHLIATHPKIEIKIRKEINDVLGSSNKCESLTLESLKEMRYLDCVIKEVLRLYPSAGFTRSPYVATKLGNYEIPAGTQIFFFPYLIHRHPDYYPDPLLFCPERWQKPKKPSRKNPYLPFSLGPRNCIGQKLALTEIGASLVYLLVHYKFTLPINESPIPEVALHLTLSPTNVKLVVNRIKN